MDGPGPERREHGSKSAAAAASADTRQARVAAGRRTDLTTTRGDEQPSSGRVAPPRRAGAGRREVSVFPATTRAARPSPPRGARSSSEGRRGSAQNTTRAAPAISRAPIAATAVVSRGRQGSAMPASPRRGRRVAAPPLSRRSNARQQKIDGKVTVGRSRSPPSSDARYRREQRASVREPRTRRGRSSAAIGQEQEQEEPAGLERNLPPPCARPQDVIAWGRWRERRSAEQAQRQRRGSSPAPLVGLVRERGAEGAASGHRRHT